MSTEISTTTNPELVEYSTSVSHSEAEAYLRCERNHYYGYGLGIKRIRQSEALSKGLLGHEGMDKYFSFQMKAQQEGTWLVSVGPDDAAATAINYVAMSGNEHTPVILHALTWFKEFSRFFENWEILAVEKEFDLPVTDTLHIPFIIDLIARDPHGRIVVVDHKFMWDFMSDKDAELQPQLPKYIGGLRALGYPVDYAAYLILRTRDNLKEKSLDTQILWLPTPVTDERIRNTFREQFVIADRVQARKIRAVESPDGMAEWSESAVRVTNKMICNSCSFRALCVAELNDAQPQMVLDSEYTKKTRREIKPEGE